MPDIGDPVDPGKVTAEAVSLPEVVLGGVADVNPGSDENASGEVGDGASCDALPWLPLATPGDGVGLEGVGAVLSDVADGPDGSEAGDEGNVTGVTLVSIVGVAVAAAGLLADGVVGKFALSAANWVLPRTTS